MNDNVLNCLSFHSVKGGVGKSTLSWLAATELARRHATLLVDMDLTGTSLADVFPLCAPVLQAKNGKLDLQHEPGGTFHNHNQSAEMIEHRAAEPDPVGRHVPFLNDDFLTEGDRFDASRDVDPRCIAWQVETDDEAVRKNLRVIPSSALPNDLGRILPVIYDELYAGFLEARLEWFLARLLQKSDFRHVVFDSPPTVPGLSSALLSLAMRLPQQIGLTGAGWGDTPNPLREFSTVWTPVLVVTPDLQDLRATERWLTGRDKAEIGRIIVAVNKARSNEPEDVAHTLRARLAKARNETFGLELALNPEVFGYEGVILREDRVPSHLLAISESNNLRLFETQTTIFPPVIEGLRRLMQRVESLSNGG
ncbi:MAG TPA: P-loop NTPase [Candidatus Paceibacterota bacterium]|nr:P-loop NTPase [Candidatus Paceibacterota bacterium]